jgi:hypothetical protein
MVEVLIKTETSACGINPKAKAVLAPKHVAINCTVKSNTGSCK